MTQAEEQAAAKAEAEKKAAEAKAADEKKQAEEQAAAKAEPKGAIVLVHEMFGPGGKVLPVGTELNPSEEWVKRCVLPFDLWETKKLYEAKKRAAEAEEEAKEIGRKAIEDARKAAV